LFDRAQHFIGAERGSKKLKDGVRKIGLNAGAEIRESATYKLFQLAARRLHRGT
jgi:hypothetical protein